MNESSSDLVVTEGSNVSLVCTATGYPLPKITWRREDNRLINGHGNSPPIDIPLNSFLSLFLSHSDHLDYLVLVYSLILLMLFMLNDVWMFGTGNLKPLWPVVVAPDVLVEGSNLKFFGVERHQMGAYLCIASNGRSNHTIQ